MQKDDLLIYDCKTKKWMYMDMNGNTRLANTKHLTQKV